MQAHSQSPFNLVVIKYDSFFCAEDSGENHVESDSPLEIAESVTDTCIVIKYTWLITMGREGLTLLDIQELQNMVELTEKNSAHNNIQIIPKLSLVNVYHDIVLMHCNI